MSRRPNFIIAGVNKAGTTSLWSYLAQHPQVGPSDVKETCYWLPVRYDEPMPPLTNYEKHFLGQENKPVRMESTPGYFYGGKALAQAIDQACPDVKILMMFREPVGRLLSFYQFKQAQLELPSWMTLGDYVQTCRDRTPEQLRQRVQNPWFGLEGGHYARYFPDWLKVFGDRLKVLFFEQMTQDTKGALQAVSHWLELDESLLDEIDLTPTNQTMGYHRASLQRLALRINQKGERFWRKYPGLKTKLRQQYYRLNGKSKAVIEDEVTLTELKHHYARVNATFADQLAGSELIAESCPAWVKALKEVPGG